jgi:hypothetical protein
MAKAHEVFSAWNGVARLGKYNLERNILPQHVLVREKVHERLGRKITKREDIDTSRE